MVTRTKRPFRFIVKEATEADLQACLRLDHSVASEYAWQIEAHDIPGRMQYSFGQVRLPRESTVTVAQSAEALAAALDDHHCLLVAREGERVLGYINMRLDLGCSMGWIHQLVVDNDVRRRKVGSALLNEARTFARKKNLQRMTVEVQTKNVVGINFLQQFGFGFCGFHDRYYNNQDIVLFFEASLR